MSTDPVMQIFNRDEVDLIALRVVLREAELRYTADLELAGNVDGERYQRRALDQSAQGVLGRIASADCIRFEGEKENPNRPYIVKRHYAMYAMHPDTAEQVLKAIEFLIEKFGPRFEAPTRPTRIVATTKRNRQSDDTAPDVSAK